MRYDTVIVGAGSAGAVIAARLTEREDEEVLLLEAGPDYPPKTQLPDDLKDGTRNSLVRHDWGLHHIPTPGQVPFVYPRGKVVGGSSAVNTCIALRGQPYDYEEWAELGLWEWSWDRCLPAFKRLENDLDFQNEWHGNEGPIPIRRHPRDELTPWQEAFLEACEGLGFPACADHNDPRTTGAGPHAMNKIDGERMSAALCYLTPEVRARKNLTIAADTTVARLRFVRGKVVAVEAVRGPERQVVDCDRVVLCAGAIHTPAILLRSGIGPEAELARLGVERLLDLPGVARRLLDHPGAAIVLTPAEGVVSEGDPLIQTTCRYRAENSPVPNDMQLQAGGIFQLPYGQMGLVSLMCAIGKPSGTSRIRWPSAALGSKPQIDSRFLLDPDDMDKAVEAMELLMLLATSDAMRPLARFLLPGERALSSRKAIRAFVRKQCGSGYHPCGTTPMGTERDPFAVVDQYGRLRGVAGVTIADAGIMPTIPSANTNLPTLMIGERVGAWLRDGVPSS